MARGRRGSLGVKTLALGFVAGALSVFVFHQLTVWGLVGRRPWANWAPTRPLGVPAMLSIAFWGGVWGVAMVAVLRRRLGGVLFYLLAFAFGAIFPTLVSWYVVPLIKGGALGPRGLWYNALIINGMWGLGTAVFFGFLRRTLR